MGGGLESKTCANQAGILVSLGLAGCRGPLPGDELYSTCAFGSQTQVCSVLSPVLLWQLAFPCSLGLPLAKGHVLPAEIQ